MGSCTSVGKCNFLEFRLIQEAVFVVHVAMVDIVLVLVVVLLLVLVVLVTIVIVVIVASMVMVFVLVRRAFAVTV
jgi:hypothetical protein